MADEVFEAFIPMIVSVGFFTLIAWIVFVIANGRRRRAQLKVLSEFHSKILEKLGSAAEFGALVLTALHRRLGVHRF